MIDLSHLSEEEQDIILRVLKRDAKLKKSEEERIRKLQNPRNKSSETKLKYLTGEWFYEAKSRRHMDKIHGSEIILASMRQRTASAAGVTPSVPDAPRPGFSTRRAAPPKPDRQAEASQPQGTSILEPEKGKPVSAARSPVRTRHNPFNRASIIVVEPSEKTDRKTEERPQEASETEPVSPLKDHAAGQAPQTSALRSSVGFRPVPKKRTFVSRGYNNQTQVDSKVVVPAPRLRLKQPGSGGGSNQSSQSSMAAQPQETGVQSSATSHVSAAAQPLRFAKEVVVKGAKASRDAGRARDEEVPSVTKERTTASTKTDEPADRAVTEKNGERGDSKQIDYAGLHNATMLTKSIKEPERKKNGSDGTEFEEGDEELSLTRSIVDPPIRYDLNFIEKPVQHTPKKSQQRIASKLPHQVSSPKEEEEDSIAKVLEWFSRSTDSNDWLDTEEGPQTTTNVNRVGDARIDDSLTGDGKDVNENRVGKESEKVSEMHQAEKSSTRTLSKSHKIDDDDDESQAVKISNLKSFWEKGNTGPRILLSRSNCDISGKPANPSADKDREEDRHENKSHIFDTTSTTPERGKYDAYVSSSKEDKEKLELIHPHRDINFIDTSGLNLAPQQPADYTLKKGASLYPAPEIYISPSYFGKEPSDRKEDPKYVEDHLALPKNTQVIDKRVSDAEVTTLPAVSSQPREPPQTSLSLGSDRFSPQPDSLPPSRGSSVPPAQSSSSSLTPSQKEELCSASQGLHLETNSPARDSPDFEALHRSMLGQQADDQRGVNDMHLTSKMEMQRGASEDVKRKVNEDRLVQAGMSPKKTEDSTNKGATNSSNSLSQRRDSTAEKIKQLKSFWEQEMNRPVFYTGRDQGDAKVNRGSNYGKLTKRFTKSEYDLRSIVNNADSDGEDSNRNRQNFTMNMNQRQDSLSPSLGSNRVQFNNLREFWGETTLSRRGSFIAEKNRSPKHTGFIDSESPSLDLQQCVDPEINHKPTGAHTEKNSSRPAVTKSSSPSQKRDSRRGSSSKDSTREEKTSKSHSSAGKEPRCPKARKDRYSQSSSRGSAMRRATSMFTLNISEDKDSQHLFGHLKKSPEDGPAQSSQSRRQSIDRTQSRRQSTDRGPSSRRSSEDSESIRARAFVPRDYRHYLGMTEETGAHASLAPAVKEQVIEVKPAHDLDLNGPVRASTPAGSEERYGRRGSKTAQRPLSVNHSSLDTGRESSASTPSEIRSDSRNSSSWDNEDDDQNPVKKALRRAEARPKNMAKSLEDITATLAPRQERRPDPIVDLRRCSDVTSISSHSTSSFSDPEHLKKMSKSVPSFLQKELSGSVMTMYTGEYGSVEVQGNIQFSINYVQKLREFHIFVVQCQDLAAVDPKRHRSDPYVKSYLVPDKSSLGKRKTSVKKKTLNPTFNEILRYRVRMEYLRTQTLILSVWHHDTFGKNSFLGEVDLDLSKWDFDHTQMNYLALKARTTPSVGASDDRGEMKLAVRFLPQLTYSEGIAREGTNSGEVHIWVKECKNLPLSRATIDPYVKCFVLPDTSRKSRQKTRVMRRTANPTFNHTMVYDGIRQEDLTEACVELTVWDRDRLVSNLLGGLRLGLGTGRSYGAPVDWMDSTAYEAALWERMMSSPNEWIEEVLPLRMLTSAKTALK